MFVVAGSAPFDTAWEAEARRTFRPHDDRLEFVYLTGLPMDELLERVATLPEHSIVYYLHIHQDGTGKPFFAAEALDRVAAKANAPIYGHVNTYVGRGIVGGRVFSLETEGQNAARLGLRLLAGEKPESIPVPEVSENTAMFDWRQLRRWGLREDDLPPGSVVHFREPTVWDTYRWHIIAAIALCLVEAVLIAGLLVQRVKRRRADERFRRVVETVPTGMLLVDRGGSIVMANAQVERLFGYVRGELFGRPVGLLLPELPRGGHAADPTGLFAAAETRPADLGWDLVGRRKDGSQFPAAIGLSHLQTPGGLFVLASIIDLTERRRTEEALRESRRDLQLLTGRLLETQELERRRIARELHDDLNQTLAFLALELDLLGRNLTASSGDAAGHIRGLSARVKELCSTVHDMSHQLHPSKLEQLGLVAAVRGLCRDFTEHHGLELKLTHHDVPEAIPEATALCLYRIVQEALRNVIKHSKSRWAAVELTGVAGGIGLRVADGGVGFDPAATKDGLGLISMRERLHLVEGTIAIDSRPLGGTRIVVRVPVPRRDPARPEPGNVPAAAPAPGGRS